MITGDSTLRTRALLYGTVKHVIEAKDGPKSPADVMSSIATESDDHATENAPREDSI
jgi:hypothetical protein